MQILPRLRLAVAPLLLATLAGAAPAPGPAVPASLLAAFPPRLDSAPTGSELVARLASLSPEERGRALLDQLLQGNLPSFLRQLQPVELSLAGPAGAARKATVWVTPDYLAVGSDDDFVRVPLGLEEALTVARRFGCTLPTTRIVDSVYRQAQKKVAPQPMPACAAMTSMAYLSQHNRTIEGQLRGLSLGTLVSGDKKDLVLTRRLETHPGKVAIYGWHRPDGRPIQPLSTVHEAAYADYSHGIRLVSDTVFVDGQPRSIFDVLEDATLVDLLSSEGVDRHARRVLGSDEPRPVLRAALVQP